MAPIRLFIAGKWQESSFIAKGLGYRENFEYFQATSLQIAEALKASQEAFVKYRRSSRYARSVLLNLMSEKIARDKNEFVAAIVEQSKKPVTLAQAEVQRAITTFSLASEEAKRFCGEILALDIDAQGRAYNPAVVNYVPKGPVLAIAPFNFPLNLVAHKVAPALAVGCSIILKPPPQAPGPSEILAKIFSEAQEEILALEEIPQATLQIVHCANELTQKILSDPIVKILSFTGSEKVGWMLRDLAYHKSVILELGGNAAVIIEKDADIKRAAKRCAFGAFAYSGQICISVQRIFIQKEIIEQFISLFLHECRKVKVGDLWDKDTILGPLIDENALKRVLCWIEEAKSKGAKVLLGGEFSADTLMPTVLFDVPRTEKLFCEEVFAPVVVLEAYNDLKEAIHAVNSSRFGLQAGIFSNSEKVISLCAEEVEVGGLIINDIPTYRADNMPYGGIKGSGLGREGVRFAMEGLSECKTVVRYRE